MHSRRISPTPMVNGRQENPSVTSDLPRASEVTDRDRPTSTDVEEGHDISSDGLPTAANQNTLTPEDIHYELRTRLTTMRLKLEQEVRSGIDHLRDLALEIERVKVAEDCMDTIIRQSHNAVNDSSSNETSSDTAAEDFDQDFLNNNLDSAIPSRPDVAFIRNELIRQRNLVPRPAHAMSDEEFERLEDSFIELLIDTDTGDDLTSMPLMDPFETAAAISSVSDPKERAGLFYWFRQAYGKDVEDFIGTEN